jgi:hypothetical protein
MLLMSMLTTALAGPPHVGDVVIGQPVPEARKTMCAPIGGDAYRCRAQTVVINGVTGNMAIERCNELVFGVKFVALAVPGVGHNLEGALETQNPLDDSRGLLDKLRAYFVEQGFKIDPPGEMGPTVVTGKGEGAKIELQMGPVTDVPELPPGAWQAGFVLASETTCGA